MDLIHGTLQRVQGVIPDACQCICVALRGLLQRNGISAGKGDLIGRIKVDLVAVRLAPIDLEVPHGTGRRRAGRHKPAGGVRRIIALGSQRGKRVVARGVAGQVLLFGVDLAPDQDFSHLLVNRRTGCQDRFAVKDLIRAQTDIAADQVGDQGASRRSDVGVSGLRHTAHTPGHAVDEIDLRPGRGGIVRNIFGIQALVLK